MNVALVTCQSLAQYPTATTEDALLTGYLRQNGHAVTSEVWTDPAVAWASYDAVLLKTPWDYFDRIQEFYAWLDRLEALRVPLLNPVARVRWNADKKYLTEMAQAGVQVVPTYWLPRGTRFEADHVFRALATEHLIVKPAVSGGAKNTFRIPRSEAAAATARLEVLLQDDDFLAQPFLPQIQRQGEWSFLFFGGHYSHTVLKTPKAGDFRVQHTLGGAIATPSAPAPLLAAATAIARQFAPDCLYARVDGVEVDGEFWLMELELIEPFLYLEFAPPTALAKYEVALRQLTKSH